jgi:hypothetical protein
MRPEIAVPTIGPTERLVPLPALDLVDAATGGRPRLSTKLRLAHRGGELLARFDGRHRGVTATMRRDNDPLWKEDVVEIFLAAEDPPRRYLELEVNPLGARFCAWVEAPDFSREGRAVSTFEFPEFRAEARVRPERWSALLRVPLSGLGGPPPATSRKSSADDGLPVPRGPWPPSPLAPGALLGNFFRIDRASGSFQALFPTNADPPDFHRPEAFGRLILKT